MEGREQLLRLGDGRRIERVVHPATLTTVGEKTGVLERLEVPGQPRLRELQLVGELANTAFPTAQQRNDAQPNGVGECVKELGGSGLAVGSGQGSHGSNI